MMRDEEFVRASWTNDKLDDYSTEGNVFMFMGDCSGWTFTSWAAAAEFTREWLEQISKLQDDIEWINEAPHIRGDVSQSRILARLESALADLRRGMK